MWEIYHVFLFIVYNMKKMFLICLFCFLLVMLWCWSSHSTSNRVTWKCKDVTSYDHNRNNDMKCMSTNWDVKYTSYEWARVLESL